MGFSWFLDSQIGFAVFVLVVIGVPMFLMIDGLARGEAACEEKCTGDCIKVDAEVLNMKCYGLLQERQCTCLDNDKKVWELW
jgi:hypothetical protein